VIDDGIKEHRFSPLPAPPDKGRALRAAYAVSAALVRNARSYWLEHESGKRTNLPMPEAGVARMTGDEPGPSADDADLPDAYDETRRLEQRIRELEEVHAREVRDAAHKTAAAERRLTEAQERADLAERRERTESERQARATASAESLQARLADLEQDTQALRNRLAVAEREVAQAAAAREPLERELAELRGARRSLERDLDHARERLRVMTSERDEFSRQAAAFDGIAVKARDRASRAEREHQKAAATLQELEVWRAELERRLAATTTELGAAKAAREADQRELERLREALATAEVPAVGSGRLAVHGDSSATLAAQAAEIERLAAEVATLRARAAQLG
jgi:chromosome segregation ATPase